MIYLTKALFLLRVRYNFISLLRTAMWRALGAHIGPGTVIPPRTIMNWPHQVSLGARCVLETDIQFKYSAPYRPGPCIVVGDRVFLGRGCEFNSVHHIEVGDDCLIASGCKFIDGKHGTAAGSPMNIQPLTFASVKLERDVWLGTNVTVLKGVSIGEGAIVAAGAVVTKPVPAGEIWAGIPARKIGVRTETSEAVG